MQPQDAKNDSVSELKVSDTSIVSVKVDQNEEVFYGRVLDLTSLRTPTVQKGMLTKVRQRVSDDARRVISKDYVEAKASISRVTPVDETHSMIKVRPFPLGFSPLVIFTMDEKPTFLT